MKHLFLFVLGLLLFFGCSRKEESMNDLTSSYEVLFIGTYTKKEGHVNGQGEGIYVYAMDKQTGRLSYLNVSDSTISPSYVAVHPNGEFVYAVNEFDGGDKGLATVSAFRFDQERYSLELINTQSSLGQYPCHISIDNSGQYVMAANYVGGSVAFYPIEKDGALGVHNSYKKHEGSGTHPRQDAPHAHMIMQHPTLNFVTAVDLGADRIYEYEIDSIGQTLNYVDDYPNSPRMSGPRHMAFHPTLDIAYTLNELIGTIEVSPLVDSTRFRRSFQVISTQEIDDERPAASAAIKVHPNGKFLYASNRGEVNEIVVFSINDRGILSKVGVQSTLGLTPRDFEIDPSGRFLLAANQDSNTIVTFAIDQESGMLSETGNIAEVSTPVCLKFLNP